MVKLKSIAAALLAGTVALCSTGCGAANDFFDELKEFGRYEEGAYSMELEIDSTKDTMLLGMYMDGEYNKKGEFELSLSIDSNSVDFATGGKTKLTDLLYLNDKMYINIKDVFKLAGVADDISDIPDYVEFDATGSEPLIELSPDEAYHVGDLTITEATLDVKECEDTAAGLLSAAMTYLDETFGKVDPPLVGTVEGGFYFSLNKDNFSSAVTALETSLNNSAYDTLYKELTKVVNSTIPDVNLDDFTSEKLKTAIDFESLKTADMTDFNLYWEIVRKDGKDTMQLKLTEGESEVRFKFIVASQAVKLAAPTSTLSLEEFQEKMATFMEEDYGSIEPSCGTDGEDDIFGGMSGDSSTLPGDWGISTDTSKSTPSGEDIISLAESYIKNAEFSRDELIEQLEYEGFIHEESVDCVDNLEVDWNAEALEAANFYITWHEYGYSSESLTECLEEVDGFTHAQATYAVEHCNADWNEQAVKCVRSYIEFGERYPEYSHTQDELLVILQSEEGFTLDQATYGIETVLAGS